MGQETAAADNVEAVDLAVVHRGRPRPSTVFVGQGIGLLDAGEVGMHLAFHCCSPF